MIVLTQQDNVRFHTVKILTDFDRTGERLSTVSSLYFGENKKISHPEELTYLVQEITRWRAYLDGVIDSIYRGKYSKVEHILKNILRLGAYELMFRNQIPDYAVVNEAVKLTRQLASEKASGLTNAVLRKLLKVDYPEPGVVVQTKNPETLAEATSHPQWMVKRWLKRYGFEETLKLCKWNNQIPSFTVWMNWLRVETVQWEETVTSLGIDWSKSQVIRNLYHINSLSSLFQSEGYRKGWFTVQDTSAALIGMLVGNNLGFQLLDVCCAPGGKTAALAVNLGDSVSILASDYDEKRVIKVLETLERLRISNVTVKVKDATKDDYPVSDVILIDAPCTGTGVLSKRADLRWRRTIENLMEMQSLQLEILRHMSNFVAPNGRIIYSTCSMEPEENWDVIDMLLEIRNDFKVVRPEKTELLPFLDERGAILTFPPRDGMDGVFGVILQKC